MRPVVPVCLVSPISRLALTTVRTVLNLSVVGRFRGHSEIHLLDSYFLKVAGVRAITIRTLLPVRALVLVNLVIFLS